MPKLPLRGGIRLKDVVKSIDEVNGAESELGVLRVSTKSMEEGRGEVEDVIRPLNMYRY